MNIFKLYNNLILKYPISVKAATSGFLFSLGDLICQKCVEKRKDFQFRRNFNFFVFGSISGPIFHYWYSIILPRLLNVYIPRTFSLSHKLTKVQEVGIQLFCDQTFFACTFNCFFYMGINLLSKGSFQSGIDQIRDKIWITLLNNWKIWPAAMLIGFSVVPNQYRALWANCVGLVYNVVLSYIQNN